jgi:hypothetical protein
LSTKRVASSYKTCEKKVMVIVKSRRLFKILL